VLRYTSVGDEIAQHQVTMPLTVNLVSADEAAAAGADPVVTEEVVILRSAQAQQQARELADRREFDQARKLLAEAADDLRRIAPSSPKADELLVQADTLEQQQGFLDPAAYDLTSRKQMLYSERLYKSRRMRRRPSSDE
jgi:hypothetical protein